MKKLSQEDFNFLYRRVPRLAVEAVIVHKGEILLTKRIISTWKGYWHIPGGTVLLHESLKKAVKRVVREEVGINISIVEELGVSEFIKEGGERHVVTVVYLCRPLSFNVKLDKTADDFGYFAHPPSKTIAEHKKYFKKYV